MATIKVPYFKWRDGRPRWEPGPDLRHAGAKGRDLKDDTGQWLALEPAIAAARALTAAAAAGRVDGRMPPTLKRAPKTGRTCAALWQRWRLSPEFSRLAPKTRADYAVKIGVFLDREFGDAPLAAITKPMLKGLWEELYHDRGHHMANAVLASVSSMITYAEGIGWRGENTNPARNMRRPKPAERRVLILPAECAHLVATADAMGHVSIGDAIVIALHSGQREGDVLAMPPRVFAEDRVRLTHFHSGRGQAKTGALLDAPMTEALAFRIAAIRARWHAAGVVSRETMVARELDGAPYDQSAFQKLFATVRAEAAKKDGFAALAAKRFQDLRDTAVTRLALADCTIPQIGAITGHSPKTITTVIQHYLVMQPEMADAAISKLQTWLDANKVAI